MTTMRARYNFKSLSSSEAVEAWRILADGKQVLPVAGSLPHGSPGALSTTGRKRQEILIRNS